jgi:hypothetical protein
MGVPLLKAEAIRCATLSAGDRLDDQRQASHSVQSMVRAVVMESKSAAGPT